MQNDSFDFEVQNQQIARKRALSEALTKQAMETPQGQMVSGHYVGPGWAGILAPLTKAAIGGYNDKAAGEQQANYNTEYRKQLSEGLNNYLTTRNGAPGGTLSDAQAGNLLNNDQAPPASAMTEPVQADPRKAITTAMTSRIPELQAIGKADFGTLSKGEQGELKEVNGVLMRVYPNNKVQTLADNRNPLVVNQRLVAANGQQVGDYRDKYGEVEPVARPPNQAPIYGQRQPDTGEVKFAPGGSTFAPTNLGNKKALDDAGDVMKASREQVIQGKTALDNAQQLYGLAKDPEVIAGAAAGPSGVLAAFGAKLGITGPDAAAKTQIMLGLQAKQTLQASKDLKGAISDKEKPFLEAASAGQINWTPEALQHLAGLTMATAHNAILTGTQQHQSAGTVTGAEEISKLYPMPPIQYQLPGGEAMWKQQPGGRVQYNGTYSTGNLGQGKPPTVSNW